MDLPTEVQRLCADFDHREIRRTEFLDRCTRLVASTIGCSRAGIWVFNGERPALSLRCLAMYDATRDRMTQVPDEEGPPVAEYFLALEQTGHVMATDARAHFATAGFFGRFLEANHVKSLLAAAFSVNGRLYGAFTCTQVGTEKEWTRPELASLRVIGSRVSLALANADRSATDTQPALLRSR
jgi:GAF domain-containing protein